MILWLNWRELYCSFLLPGSIFEHILIKIFLLCFHSLEGLNFIKYIFFCFVDLFLIKYAAFDDIYGSCLSISYGMRKKENMKNGCLVLMFRACSCSFWVLYFCVPNLPSLWLTGRIPLRITAWKVALCIYDTLRSSYCCLFKPAPVCHQLMCIHKHSRINCQREQLQASIVLHGLGYTLFTSFNHFSLHFGAACVFWISKLLD